MRLNESRGNMYKFVTHTGNPIKGRCLHNCPYCYMKKLGSGFYNLRLDRYELTSNTEEGNFIFIGSSTDMFAENIPHEWIIRVLDHCDKFDNKYLFQSKNPRRILEFISHPVFKKSVVCTTIETNRFYSEVMGNAPEPADRASAMEDIDALGIETYVTIEPIMDFDLKELVEFIKRCKPKQVNIGMNSWREIKLPEPNPEDVHRLIDELNKFTKVEIKDNIKGFLRQQ